MTNCHMSCPCVMIGNLARRLILFFVNQLNMDLLKITLTFDNTQPSGTSVKIENYGEATISEKSIKFGKTNLANDKIVVASTNAKSTMDGEIFSSIFCLDADQTSAIMLVRDHLIKQYVSKMENIINIHSAALKAFSINEPSGVDHMSYEIHLLKQRFLNI